MAQGVQGFRLPPTFSLLWTLGPNQVKNTLFLFLLSFLSRVFGKLRRQRRCFFYLSNTENNSQCALPTNWSTGTNFISLYPPRVNISISRRKVIGLHETYITRGTLLFTKLRHCAIAPARGGSIMTQSYPFNIPTVSGSLNKSRFNPHQQYQNHRHALQM